MKILSKKEYQLFQQLKQRMDSIELNQNWMNSVELKNLKNSVGDLERRLNLVYEYLKVKEEMYYTAVQFGFNQVRLVRKNELVKKPKVKK